MYRQLVLLLYHQCKSVLLKEVKIGRFKLQIQNQFGKLDGTKYHVYWMTMSMKY